MLPPGIAILFLHNAGLFLWLSLNVLEALIIPLQSQGSLDLVLLNSQGLLAPVFLHKDKRILEVLCCELTLSILVPSEVVSFDTWTLAEILHLYLILEVIHIGP